MELLQINHAALPDAGEDSFALRSDEQGAFLCVTDGCGGLGSRRYAALENRTGAYVAAHLVTNAVQSWAQAKPTLHPPWMKPFWLPQTALSFRVTLPIFQPRDSTFF